ncbi:hypothetical protein C8Q76DRAFT_804383 [Earliella scabrosa]|nr:hypothetical protein C8Q76DRAFT_804383 [Earliella scabrosa]
MHVLQLQCSSGSQFLAGEITEEDWARFRMFASLIREVRLDLSGSAEAHPSVFAHLAHRLNGERLLPRLRTLASICPSPLDTHLLLILTPTIRRFDLYNLPAVEARRRLLDSGEVEGTQDVLVRAICRTAPFIEDLKLNNFDHRAPIVALGALKHLRTLNLAACWDFGEDLDSLRVLANMEHLEELTNISVYPRADQWEPTEPLAFSGFPKLAVLDMDCDVTAIGHVLRTVRGPLSTVRIRAMGMADEWSQAFATMVECVPALRTLVLNVMDGASEGPETWDLSIFLEPFLHVRAMEEVQVQVSSHEPSNGRMSLNVGDEDAEVVAKAWPKLRTLSLDVHSEHAPTLVALATLAAQCPALETLLLHRLDTGQDGVESGLPSPLPSHGALRRLSVFDVEKLHIANRVQAADIVSRMFPRLDREASAKPAERVYGVKEVFEEIPALRAADPKFVAGASAWREFIEETDPTSAVVSSA